MFFFLFLFLKRVYIAVGEGGDGTGLKSAKQVQGAAKERIGCDVSNFDRRMCQISGMNDCSRQLVPMSA